LEDESSIRILRGIDEPRLLRKQQKVLDVGILREVPESGKSEGESAQLGKPDDELIGEDGTDLPSRVLPRVLP
jgi:hypothetical protein